MIHLTAINDVRQIFWTFLSIFDRVQQNLLQNLLFTLWFVLLLGHVWCSIRFVMVLSYLLKSLHCECYQGYFDMIVFYTNHCIQLSCSDCLSHRTWRWEVPDSKRVFGARNILYSTSHLTVKAALFEWFIAAGSHSLTYCVPE